MKVIWRGLGLCLAVLGLVGAMSFGISALAQQADEPDVTLLSSAVLQNPGFDNHRWYEFRDRYGNWLVGSWVPDGDYVGSPQDWRLWYMRNTPLIKSYPESGIVHAGVESVALRSYDGNVQEGGLYQIVYNVTPCLVYQFQMHALSRPDADVPNKTAELRVGIDPTGWYLNPAVDPAMPGYYPPSIVWSAPQDFKYPYFGQLGVSAEARADRLTVYTRALAFGGVKHAIVWDTGALLDITPARIADPDQLPAPGGVGVPQVFLGPGTATIQWTSTLPGIGQVYYRSLGTPGTIPPPSDPLTHTVYLPLVQRSVPWQASGLNKSATTSHSHVISGLSSGLYEYVVVTRGLSGGACVTWASQVQTFVVP